MVALIERPIARGKPAEYGQEIAKRRYRRTVEKVSLANKVVVDFGCGNGAQTYEFIKSGAKIIALDIKYEHLHSFKNLLRSHHVESVLVVQCDGFRLPIATGWLPQHPFNAFLGPWTRPRGRNAAGLRVDKQIVC